MMSPTMSTDPWLVCKESAECLARPETKMAMTKGGDPAACGLG